MASVTATACGSAVHALGRDLRPHLSIGTEFAERQNQYEKFFAGASLIMSNHNCREALRLEFRNIADDRLASYDVPEPPPAPGQVGC